MNLDATNFHPFPGETCVGLEDSLALLPLGELSAEEEATLRAHATTCARCRKRLAEYNLISTSLRQSSRTTIVSRPLFNANDIILSANLSDEDEEGEDLSSTVATVMAPVTIRTVSRRISRRVTVFSGFGALAAMLLLALLAGLLFHLRGAPNSTTRVLSGLGTLTEYSLPSSGKRPAYIVTGPDGNVWFTETGAVGRITPDGKITEYPLPVDVEPGGLAVGPGRSLVVIAGNELLRINMSGTVTRVPLPSSIDRALGSIATGPDGTIWFTVPGNPSTMTGFPLVVWRISPQGAVTSYDIRHSIPGDNIFGIESSPDGSLWVATELVIGRIGLDGKITNYDITTKVPSLNGLFDTGGGIADTNGNLWFVGNYIDAHGAATGGAVVRVAPDGSSRVWSISANLVDSNYTPIVAFWGRDGNLWAGGNGTLLRITSGGAVTAYHFPSDVLIYGMTMDRGGNLWVTESATSKIGRIHLGG